VRATNPSTTKSCHVSSRAVTVRSIADLEASQFFPARGLEPFPVGDARAWPLLDATTPS